MANLPAFVDLITFFGLAAFFAWLAYAPLQRDLLEDFEEKKETYDKARDNFYTINDYFLVSFLFYSTAMIAEYLVHTAFIPMFGRNPIQDYPPLYLVIGISFLGGLVTLAAPMWYMRAVGKGDMNLATAKLPDFGDTLGFSGGATLSIVISAASFVTASMVRRVFWFSMVILALLGVVLAMKYYHSKIRQTVGGLLILVPMIVWFVMAVLHI